ncbi:MAG: hypothetical protein H0W62_14035 [Chitinophagales bacterium]|nr:hypothetical protein [Chitinophagales bacterium]
MKKYCLNISWMFTLIACHFTTNPIETKLHQVKTGMRSNQVTSIMGSPDEKIDLGNMQDTLGNQAHMEEWLYGENQSIMIINDTVNAVTFNRKKMREKIEHIIDSARNTDRSKPFSIQPDL